MGVVYFQMSDFPVNTTDIIEFSRKYIILSDLTELY